MRATPSYCGIERGLCPLNNRGRSLSLRSKVCETYTGWRRYRFRPCPSASQGRGRHECRCTTEAVCTLIGVSDAVVLTPAVQTTALLWSAAADHLRRHEGGASSAVLAAATAALDVPGYRLPSPAPRAVDVAALTQAGTLLNEAVRQRYIEGERAGAIGAAAAAVGAAARGVGDGQSSASRAVLCCGPCNRLVKLRLDARLRAAMHAAAGANGMSFGAWVRDSVAATLGEHQARRPAAETRAARTVAGRVTGLLVQAAAVAADTAELAAVQLAEDELAAAAGRLAAWGSRR